MGTSRRGRSKMKPVPKKAPGKKKKVIVKRNLFRDQQVSPSPHIVHITTENAIREGRKFLIVNKKHHSLTPEVQVKTEPMDDDDKVSDEVVVPVPKESSVDKPKEAKDHVSEESLVDEIKEERECEEEVSNADEPNEADEFVILEKSDMDKLNAIMEGVSKELDINESGKCTGYHFKCPKCLRKYKRKGALKRHMFSHFPRKKFPCNLCDKTFTRKDSFSVHMKMHNGNSRELKKKKCKCKFCGKGFVAPSLLTIHIRTHTGERPYACEICKKTYRTHTSLRNHAVVHSGVKAFKCEECGQRFSHKAAVKRHMRIHTGEKPFVCPHCSMGFRSSSTLKAHIFYHTGENGFECKECGRCFNSKPHLQMHYLGVHKNYRPFVCETCGKAFTRKEDRERHFLVHTGEKSFACSICNKSFSMKQSLKLHMLTHIKEPPTYCPECGKKYLRTDRYVLHMRKKHSLDVKAALPEYVNEDLDSSDRETEDLYNNVKKLISLLVNKDALNGLGWPEKPVDEVLETLISRCGCEPCTDEPYSRYQRLRKNVRLLLTVVIEDDAIKELLQFHTIDEVILEVVNLGRKE